MTHDAEMLRDAAASVLFVASRRRRKWPREHNRGRGPYSRPQDRAANSVIAAGENDALSSVGGVKLPATQVAIGAQLVPDSD